jgi:hypothetical protein
MRNPSSLSWLRRGSNSAVEHSLAIRIADICNTHDIVIQYIWIPRGLNRAPDFFSRFTDLDDYTCSRATISRITAAWNCTYPSMDLFATTANTICRSFHSRFGQINTSGINSLHLPIPGVGINHAFPPVALIAQFLHHLFAHRARTIVIVPVWERNKFWRILCPDHVRTGPAITQFLALTSRGTQPDIGMGPIG